MFSQLIFFKMSCLFSLSLPRGNFFETCSRPHLKLYHLMDKSVKCIRLNIYIIYILLWIKYCLMWFERLLVFILFKFKKNVPAFPEFRLYVTHRNTVFYIDFIFLVFQETAKTSFPWALGSILWMHTEFLSLFITSNLELTSYPI